MGNTVSVPIWLLVLLVAFATVTFASHFLFPSVRWFFRRRLERAVERLNARLERPIEPFKLARRHDMIQRIIYDPDIAKAIADHAAEENIPENVAFEKAKRYAREIVPSFSASVYFGIAIRLTRGLSNALYRVRVGYFDEESLSKIGKDTTVIFVMNHRSNMDYVLVTHLVAERSALSYAAGEWARVWPLSGLIRAMGAYFIRRKSRNELYRRVLARYVYMATNGGVTQAMFPEGGLSLTGGLMPARMGLLKYITEAYDPDGNDIAFVPVGLNYDQVLEDRILIGARDDPKRRFRARIGVVAKKGLILLWKRLRGKYHRFGYVAVSFGTPLSYRAYLAEGGNPDPEPLADVLMERIGAIVPVLAVPLVSWVLKEGGTHTRADIEDRAAKLRDRLQHAHIHMPRDDFAYMVEVALRNLVLRRVLKEEAGVYRVGPDQMRIVAYYAESIAHLVPDDEDSAGARGDAAAAGL